MKKVISLLLSMTFVFSILPAFAEGTEGTPVPQIDAVVQETDKQEEQTGDRLEKQTEIEGTAQPTEPGTAVEPNQNDTADGQPQEETSSNAENGEPQVPITKPSGQTVSYEEDFRQFETDRFLVKKEDGIHVLKTDEKKNAQEFIDETRAQDATILYMQPDYPLELSAVKDGWAFTGGEEMRCAEAEPEAVFMADRMNLTYHAFRFGTGFEGVQDNVTGLGTVVAVLDTGMDTSQIQNLYQNRDEAEGDMDSDGNGYVGDISGWDFTRDVPAVNEQETRFDQWHATAVAGIITAAAPDAELLPLQIFRDGTGYTSDALRAIDYCKSTGICIVNCSWISRERNSLLEESMADSDILFVCAAGNGGINLDEVPIYPASYDLDNVITVASVNQYGALSAFSNYSERKVDIAAPGEEITISGVEDADAHLSGTSLSAAFVSAAAAMVLEREPARSPADVKETIKRSAMKLCSLDGKVSGAGTLNYQNIVNGIQEETYRYFKRNEQLMNNEFGDGASPMSLQQPLTSKAASEPSGWRPCGEMPKAAEDMASAVVDGKVYVFGGKMGSTVSDEVYCFDPAANTWTLVSTMPLGRYKHRAVEMNGKIYLCAGYQSGATTVSQIDVYDPQSNTWEDALQTPDNRTGYAAGAYAGCLYVFGGRISSSATKTVYSYDSATGEWTQEASIIKEVIDEQTIQSEHGIRVFSHWDVIEYTGAGGYIVDHYHRELEEYAAISRPVYDHKSSDGSYGYIVPDAIYMTGGRDRGDGKPRGICRIRYTGYIDPEPEWYHDREMVRALYRHNIVLSGDYLYVFGGIGLDGTQQNTVYRRNIYEYPDDHTSPKEIKENQTFSGSVNFPSDGDVFTFTPTETGKYELKRLPAMHSNKQNYLLYLWIREGEKQLYAEYFDCAGGVWMEAGKTYSFEVGDTTVDYTGNYTLKLVRVPASEDVPDVKDRAAPLIIGKEITETVMGILDQDYFYFDAPNDGTYKLSFGLEQTLSQYDRKSARIKLYDESGAVKYDLGTYEILNKAIELEAGRYTIGIVPSPYYDETRPGYTIKLDFVESVNRMLSERAKHRLLSVNNKLYAIGGVDSGFNVLDSIEEYDRAANTWKRTTQIPAPRKGMSTVAVGRKIYLLGGYEGSDYSRRVDIYDTLTKQWTQGGDILVAREKAGAALIDGKIYLAGGRDAEGYSRTVEVYDTATNTVTHQFNLPDYNGILSGMAFCGDGKLYLAGGIDKDGYSNQVYCYNGSTWEIKAQMPYQAVYADGTMHGNEFVCAAAADGKVKVLTYTPSADTWQELYSDWNPYVTDYAVGCIGDELFLMGGYYGDTFEADTRVFNLRMSEEADPHEPPIPIKMDVTYSNGAVLLTGKTNPNKETLIRILNPDNKIESILTIQSDELGDLKAQYDLSDSTRQGSYQVIASVEGSGKAQLMKFRVGEGSLTDTIYPLDNESIANIGAEITSNITPDNPLQAGKSTEIKAQVTNLSSSGKADIAMLTTLYDGDKFIDYSFVSTTVYSKGEDELHSKIVVGIDVANPKIKTIVCQGNDLLTGTLNPISVQEMASTSNVNQLSIRDVQQNIFGIDYLKLEQNAQALKAESISGVEVETLLMKNGAVCENQVSAGDNLTIRFTVDNNNNKNIRVKPVVAFYKSSGLMKNSVIKPRTMIQSLDEITFSISIKVDSKMEKGDYLKVYLWDADDMITPYMKAITISQEYQKYFGHDFETATNIHVNDIARGNRVQVAGRKLDNTSDMIKLVSPKLPICSVQATGEISQRFTLYDANREKISSGQRIFTQIRPNEATNIYYIETTGGTGDYQITVGTTQEITDDSVTLCTSSNTKAAQTFLFAPNRDDSGQIPALYDIYTESRGTFPGFATLPDYKGNISSVTVYDADTKKELDYQETDYNMDYGNALNVIRTEGTSKNAYLIEIKFVKNIEYQYNLSVHPREKLVENEVNQLIKDEEGYYYRFDFTPSQTAKYRIVGEGFQNFDDSESELYNNGYYSLVDMDMAIYLNGFKVTESYDSSGLADLWLNAEAGKTYRIELKLSSASKSEFPYNLWIETGAVNDEYYPQLWGLRNVEANKVRRYLDQNHITLNPVKVGVVDSYRDYDPNKFDPPNDWHTDLNNTLLYSDFKQFVFGNSSTHGVHLCGTIGAESNNHVGIAGVAPNTKIIPVNATLSAGTSSEGNIVNGLNHAILKGARVINMSFSYTDEKPEVKRLIENHPEILFVSAAGNTGAPSIRYPACYQLDNQISVANIRLDNKIDNTSSHNGINKGKEIINSNIAAPGKYIFSTTYSQEEMNNYFTQDYGYMSGTSMAAPHVTGIAAIILGRYENLSGTDLKRIILDSAIRDSRYTGKVTSGGRASAYQAFIKAGMYRKPFSEEREKNMSKLDKSKIVLDGYSYNTTELYVQFQQNEERNAVLERLKKELSLDCLEIVEYIDSIDLYTVKIPEGRDARKIVETMIQDKDIAYAVSTISKCEFN